MSIVTEIDHILPNLPFDNDCPFFIQILFTGALGAAVSIVIAYVISEIVGYLKE